MLFEWNFAKDYKYFTSAVPGNYDFTSINNYVEMSNECKSFLDKYEGYIVRNKYLNEEIETILQTIGSKKLLINLIFRNHLDITNNCHRLFFDAFIHS